MLLTILAYVLALPIVLLVSTLAFGIFVFCTIPLIPLGRAFHSIAIAIRFITTFASTGIAILAFIGLCSVIGVSPVHCMMLIPLTAFAANDLSRINQADQGTSRVARMLAAEGTNYDTKFYVRSEMAQFMGNCIAFVSVPFVQGIQFS